MASDISRGDETPLGFQAVSGALGALHVFASSSIDLDLFAVLDEQRSLNVNPGFQCDRLLDVAGRVALDSFRRVGHCQDDIRG